MTLAELTVRLTKVEKELEQLQARIPEVIPEPWWITQAGRFANDPVFEEAMRLGREYRESLHPDRQKRKLKKSKKNHDTHS